MALPQIALASEGMKQSVREIGRIKRVDRGQKTAGLFEGLSSAYHTTVDYAHAVTSKEGMAAIGSAIGEKAGDIWRNTMDRKDRLVERISAKKDAFVASARTKALELRDSLDAKGQALADNVNNFAAATAKKGIALTKEYFINPIDNTQARIRANSLDVLSGARSRWIGAEAALGNMLIHRSQDIRLQAGKETATANQIRRTARTRMAARTAPAMAG